MKNFIKTPLVTLISIISPFIVFPFVDGEALVKSIKKFIEFMIQIDSKYIPFIIAIILSFIIFLILRYNRKKSKQKEDYNSEKSKQEKDFERLISFFEKRDELYYMVIDDLIAKFKTYVIGNNDEHSKIIDALNESIKGSIENIKNGIFIPKEAKVEIGKDKRVKVAFDINKQHIENEKNKLKELVKDLKKLKKDELNRNIEQVSD